MNLLAMDKEIDALLTAREWLECPRYTADIEAAFLVVEYMRERGFRFEIAALHSGADFTEYVASFRTDPVDYAWGEAQSPAECICRAALAAIRHELKGIDG